MIYWTDGFSATLPRPSRWWVVESVTADPKPNPRKSEKKPEYLKVRNPQSDRGADAPRANVQAKASPRRPRIQR